MKIDQLNKHEENSFIEDSEANEAILKNIVSKDELCRFLSPLKFLEIETWRKEVPIGENMDSYDTEYRKWRTPIEILLSSAGTDGESVANTPDGTLGPHERSRQMKEGLSAQKWNKRTFEDVQRQNAEVLKRSNSDTTRKFETVNPRIRQISSAGEKSSNLPRQSSNPFRQNKSAAFVPVDGITDLTDALNFIKCFGHTYVNHRSGSLFTRDAVMTSYFAPGRPVTSSRLHNRKINDSSRNGDLLTRPTTQPSLSPFASSQTRRGVTHASSSKAAPPSTIRKITSSPWTGLAQGMENRVEGKKKAIPDLKFNSSNGIRPQTAYDEVVQLYENCNQRQSTLRVFPRNLNRGWRSWNKRAIENRLNCAAQIYHNAVTTKKSPSYQIKTSQNDILVIDHENSEALRSKTSARGSSGGRKIIKGHARNGNNTETVGNKGKDKTNSEYVTRISYSLMEGNKITTTRIPGIAKTSNIMPATIHNDVPVSNENNKFSGESSVNTNQINDAIPTSDIRPVPDKSIEKIASSPWVIDAFNSTWTENEGFYARKLKPNKTVTFRLNSTLKHPSKTLAPRGNRDDVKIEPQRNHSVVALNKFGNVGENDKGLYDNIQQIGSTGTYRKNNIHSAYHMTRPWPDTTVRSSMFSNTTRFASAMNSIPS